MLEVLDAQGLLGYRGWWVPRETEVRQDPEDLRDSSDLQDVQECRVCR